jgi:hypothetical protein
MDTLITTLTGYVSDVQAVAVTAIGIAGAVALAMVIIRFVRRAGR